MNRLDQQVEFAAGKFDLLCANARDAFVRSMCASGWTAEEACQAFKFCETDVEEARAKMLDDVRVCLVESQQGPSNG
jgi:hypothetical protein